MVRHPTGDTEIKLEPLEPPCIIAGLSLKNLKPRVWDPHSNWYLKNLKGVMLSYADFHAKPVLRRLAMTDGLHGLLGAPARLKVYIDNGAFCFLRANREIPMSAYEEFVAATKPDWYPIPRDYIPSPASHHNTQRACFRRTMAVNRSYNRDHFVPVAHVGRMLENYIEAISRDRNIAAKPELALGGIVPNLLRTPKALPYADVLSSLRAVRRAFPTKHIHVFGIGGTATLHLATLLGFNSIDSSGWRNRAARGIIQLPGKGDRVLLRLGNWKGRVLDEEELEILKRCECPACLTSGSEGLTSNLLEGFCNRATHNLWVLLQEASWIESRGAEGTYRRYVASRIDNSVYRPLIEHAMRTHAPSRYTPAKLNGLDTNCPNRSV